MNDRKEVCLVRRSDNGLWALPGGAQDLGETPEECARREFEEETGLQVRITRLLGVFSSLRYDAITNVNRGREVTHILFAGEIVGGKQKTSVETLEIGWFGQEHLPALSDGHALRVDFGFRALENPRKDVYFE
ncbi:MAG: NUDIX domain-containing protein [Dehalococcoidales bacterium]|nr:MAG: NUDIX domain-containing protein [Dehalococcoidales bacterium]